MGLGRRFLRPLFFHLSVSGKDQSIEWSASARKQKGAEERNKKGRGRESLLGMMTMMALKAIGKDTREKVQ